VSVLSALQAALAAEHATIYGYGVVGAVMRGDDRTYATQALAAHQAQRDRLTAMINAQHATPVVAAPAYRLPTAVGSRASARDLAAHLEEGSAGALWDLIAAAGAGENVRSLAISWLSDAAVRAAHWGARQALPGQPA
jgi:hypothetical protein